VETGAVGALTAERLPPRFAPEEGLLVPAPELSARIASRGAARSNSEVGGEVRSGVRKGRASGAARGR
jgi:hypothetical protein